MARTRFFRGGVSWCAMLAGTAPARRAKPEAAEVRRILRRVVFICSYVLLRVQNRATIGSCSPESSNQVVHSRPPGLASNQPVTGRLPACLGYPPPQSEDVASPQVANGISRVKGASSKYRSSKGRNDAVCSRAKSYAPSSRQTSYWDQRFTTPFNQRSVSAVPILPIRPSSGCEGIDIFLSSACFNIFLIRLNEMQTASRSLEASELLALVSAAVLATDLK